MFMINIYTIIWSHLIQREKVLHLLLMLCHISDNFVNFFLHDLGVLFR